ncbi:hypothetical protein [Microlunatus soli]|uniref:Uncharacterized protein n=1 Tax=Microlunatus soli TaxID=630515 RepID=A0A1H1UV38_9ACTN|nr:hypothetical protein [Microlunatus soli]SDS76335.1 hypothetical protein SAMN04489812_2946 [Microlunatus soli]
MTSYILRTGSQVAVPAAPLVAQVQGGRGFGHRWSVRGTTTQPPFIERPDRIVLPSITEPVTLRILPVDDPSRPGAPVRFASQSLVTVVIRHDRAAADADQVILDEVDLSGLTHRDLVQLVPDGRQIRVIGLRTVADTPLPPVAEIARDAAREILGVAQVEPDRAVQLAAMIDLSASMRPALRDGSVAAACDVLAGIGTVIAPGRQLTAAAGTLTGRRLATAAPDRFAAEVGSALAADGSTAGTGTGFRSGSATDQAATLDRTVVVTSGVPADWPSAPDAAGAGNTGNRAGQLLILGSPGRSTDWPTAAGGTVIDRGALIADPPDRELITAAVKSLLTALHPDPEVTR